MRSIFTFYRWPGSVFCFFNSTLQLIFQPGAELKNNTPVKQGIKLMQSYVNSGKSPHGHSPHPNITSVFFFSGAVKAGPLLEVTGNAFTHRFNESISHSRDNKYWAFSSWVLGAIAKNLIHRYIPRKRSNQKKTVHRYKSHHDSCIHSPPTNYHARLLEVNAQSLFSKQLSESINIVQDLSGSVIMTERGQLPWNLDPDCAGSSGLRFK